MELVLKVSGIGFLIMILGNLLSASGKNDWVTYVNLAGVIFVMGMVFNELYRLFNTVQTMFNL